MFFWQWWCSDDLNRAINKSLFTQQIVLELGLLNYFDAWSLEPTPFFKASDDGTDWESLDDDFSYTLSLSESCCFFSLSPPQKSTCLNFFPKKRCRDSLRFKKLLLSPSTPWELGSPHHLSSRPWRLESFEELVQFLMIYRRREGFSHKEARVSWRGKGP